MSKAKDVSKQQPKLRVGKLSEFRPQAQNANKHTPKGMGMLRKAMQGDGYVAPVTAAADGEVIDGSARVETAYDAFPDDAIILEHDGTRPIIAVRTDIKSAKSAKAKRIAVAANRIAQVDLEWDIDVLKDMPADVLEGLFDADDLVSMGLDSGAAADNADAEPQIDRAEELRAKWQTETGQLWRIGEHRLLCGDSTRREDVERVMSGERAQLCFTSPPYGQQRDYKSKIGDWHLLMSGVFGSAPMSDDAQVLVNLGMVFSDGEVNEYWNEWIKWMKSAGWKFLSWYVWDKMMGLPGESHGRLQTCHEWVFHFSMSAIPPAELVPVKSKKMGAGLRRKDGVVRRDTKELGTHRRIHSVIRVTPQMGGIEGHPAPFPVGLVTPIVESWPGLVYEPFAGSGTTIVACQQLGRKCRAIEISPAYVAVILERMKTAFPELNIEKVKA